MLNEDVQKLIGACGINCTKCGIYQAHTEKDVERQLRIAKNIFGEDTEVLPEQIACEGCGGSPDVHWNAECKMKLCAYGKGLLVCSQCQEFPCEDLEAFHKGNEKARQNAMRQLEIGLEAWWSEQESK